MATFTENDIALMEFDSSHKAVIDPEHDGPADIPERVLMAFVTQENFDQFLSDKKAEVVGMYSTITQDTPIYRYIEDGTQIGVCRIPLGAPAAVLLEEYLMYFGAQKLLAVGSCGTLDGAEKHSLFVPTSAIRDEGTSFHYMAPSSKIELDRDFAEQVMLRVSSFGHKVEEVCTWTTDGFFRETKARVEKRIAQGARVVDMECSALAACAQFRKAQFAQILFAADTLENTEEWNDRGFARSSQAPICALGAKVLATL